MKPAILLYSLLLISLSSVAQMAEDDKTVSERIFIHTDKSGCVAGDTIWYKAYLFDGHLPGSVSTNLYVELIDEKGIVLFTHKLPVFDGMANGDFEINDSLQHGYYFLRAYTPQMLQSGKQLPVKMLAVFNPSFIPEKYKKSPAVSYDIRFYPENGQLVSGLTNTVAFRITTPPTPAELIQILVTDSKNDTVAFVSPVTDGAGSFSFTPALGEKYKAELIVPGAEHKSFSIPVSQNSGVLLSVAENSKGKLFLVQKSGDVLKDNEAILQGVMFDKIVFREPIRFSNNEANGIIPIAKLPPGILHLTVTDNSDKIFAKRPVTISKPGLVTDLIFKKDTIGFSAKAKNVITVGLPDSTEGNFSVSVTAIDNTDIINNNSILNTVLLNAESAEAGEGMKLFSADAAKKTADEVLLSNKLIHPEIIKAGTKPLQDNYITLSGKVFKYGTKKALSKGNLMIMMRTKDSASSFIKVPVNNDGTVLMDGMVYDDTAKFYFQPDDRKTGKVEMAIDKPAPLAVPVFTPPSIPGLYTDRISFAKPEIKREVALVKTYIEKTKEEYKLLENVTVFATRRKPIEVVNKKYTSGMFSTLSNVRVFDFISEPPVGGAQNIFQYLQGQVAGLRIDWRGGTNYSLTTSRAMSMTGGMIPVQVYLNEMEVDVNALLSVSIKDIALVKYFPAGSNAMFGFGVGGRLCIWTKKFDDYSDFERGQDNFFYAPGYTPTQEFIQPDYSKGVFTNPDNRKTLYWNPGVNITSEQREIKIRFFNSDNAKKYKVVIQGFTYDGRFIDFEKIFE